MARSYTYQSRLQAFPARLSGLNANLSLAVPETGYHGPTIWFIALFSQDGDP